MTQRSKLTLASIVIGARLTLAVWGDARGVVVLPQPAPAPILEAGRCTPPPTASVAQRLRLRSMRSKLNVKLGASGRPVWPPAKRGDKR